MTQYRAIEPSEPYERANRAFNRCYRGIVIACV